MFTRSDDEKSKPVLFYLNGRQVQGQESDTIASALLLNGIATNRKSVLANQPRGPACLMGVCYECLVTINGKHNQQACQHLIEEGMRVETSTEAGSYDQS